MQLLELRVDNILFILENSHLLSLWILYLPVFSVLSSYCFDDKKFGMYGTISWISNTLFCLFPSFISVCFPIYLFVYLFSSFTFLVFFSNLLLNWWLYIFLFFSLNTPISFLKLPILFVHNLHFFMSSSFFNLFHVYGCFTCVYVRVPHAYRNLKRVDPMQLLLGMVVKHHVSTGKWTPVLGKSILGS